MTVFLWNNCSIDRKEKSSLFCLLFLEAIDDIKMTFEHREKVLRSSSSLLSLLMVCCVNRNRSQGMNRKRDPFDDSNKERAILSLFELESQVLAFLGRTV